MSNVSNKQPKNWSDEDIISWANGDLNVGSTLKESDLAAEALRRLGADGNDVETAKKAVLDSLNVGLGAEEAVDGEPDSPLTEEPEEAVEETDPHQFMDDIDPHQIMDKIEPSKETVVTPVEVTVPDFGFEHTSPIVTASIQAEVSRFIEKMAPGKTHGPNEGQSLQTNLWTKVIKPILSMEGQEFNTNFAKLLEMVQKYRQAHFHEAYAYRYWKDLKISNTARTSFESILHLLLTTCDPKNRQVAIQQVDLSEVTRTFPDESVLQKLEGFYQGK